MIKSAPAIRCILLWGLLLMLPFLPGCQAEIPTDGDPMIYPVNTEDAGDLDIQLRRDGFWDVYVTNRSSLRIDKATLWLNDRWGGEISNLQVGERRTVDLEDFYNAYGQCYPTGNPLQPKLSKPLIKADLQIGEKMYRLNIIMEKDWRTQY